MDFSSNNFSGALMHTTLRHQALEVCFIYDVCSADYIAFHLTNSSDSRRHTTSGIRRLKQPQDISFR